MVAGAPACLLKMPLCSLLTDVDEPTALKPKLIACPSQLNTGILACHHVHARTGVHLSFHVCCYGLVDALAKVLGIGIISYHT